MELGRETYRVFFRLFRDLPTTKYKVEHWDAGWWQIKKCLVEAGLESERLESIEEIEHQIGTKIYEEAGDLGILSST